MNRPRHIKIPALYYQELKEEQQRLREQTQRHVNLWECLPSVIQRREHERIERDFWFGPKKTVNRKGNLFDMFTIMFMICVALVVMVVFVTFINGFNTSVQESQLPSAGKQFIGTIQSQNGWVMDFIFVMFLIGLPLASAMLAYFNNIPPFFYFVTLGLWLLVIVIANVLGDAYASMAEDPGLSTALLSLPMTDFIMSHFVIYMFFGLGVLAWAVYVKSSTVMI